MAAMYAHQKAKDQRYKEEKKEHKVNPWNDHQRAHAGDGRTREQAALEYYKHHCTLSPFDRDPPVKKEKNLVVQIQNLNDRIQNLEHRVKRDKVKTAVKVPVATYPPQVDRLPPPPPLPTPRQPTFGPPNAYKFQTPAVPGVQNPVTTGFSVQTPGFGRQTPTPTSDRHRGFGPAPPPTPTLTSTPTHDGVFGGGFFGPKPSAFVEPYQGAFGAARSPCGGNPTPEPKTSSPFANYKGLSSEPPTPTVGANQTGTTLPPRTHEHGAPPLHTDDIEVDPRVLKRLTDRDDSEREHRRAKDKPRSHESRHAATTNDSRKTATETPTHVEANEAPTRRVLHTTRDPGRTDPAVSTPDDGRDAVESQSNEERARHRRTSAVPSIQMPVTHHRHQLHQRQLHQRHRLANTNTNNPTNTNFVNFTNAANTNATISTISTDANSNGT